MTIRNRRVKITEVVEEPKPTIKKPKHRVSTMSKMLEVLCRNKSQWVRVVEYQHPKKAACNNQPVYNHFSQTKKNFQSYLEPLGFSVECRADYDWANKRSFYYMRLIDSDDARETLTK